MVSERFSPAELLTDEALLSEAGRRMNLSADLLERLAGPVDNRTFDIFLFLWKYGPATFNQLVNVFSDSTLRRVLPDLEAVQVIYVKDFKYWLRR